MAAEVSCKAAAPKALSEKNDFRKWIEGEEIHRPSEARRTRLRPAANDSVDGGSPP